MGNSDKNYLCIGSTNNLKRKFTEHNEGHSIATKNHLPLKLSAYIVLDSEMKEKNLEKYFKTGSGKVFQWLS